MTSEYWETCALNLTIATRTYMLDETSILAATSRTYRTHANSSHILFADPRPLQS